MVMDGVSVCLWRCPCLMLSKGGPVFWWWAARSVDGLPDLRTTCFQSCLVLGVWMRGTCDLWSHFSCGLLCEHHAQDTHWECEAFNCPHRLDQLCRAAADQPLCKHTLHSKSFQMTSMIYFVKWMNRSGVIWKGRHLKKGEHLQSYSGSCFAHLALALSVRISYIFQMSPLKEGG